MNITFLSELDVKNIKNSTYKSASIVKKPTFSAWVNPVSLPAPIEDFKVLSPDKSNKWHGFGVSNPGAVRLNNGNIVILYREMGLSSELLSKQDIKDFMRADQRLTRVSGIGMAELSADGKKVLYRSSEPVLSTLNNRALFEKYPNGFEDPRINKIGDEYYIHLCAVNEKEVIESSKKIHWDINKPISGQYMYLVKTKDFKTFEHIGVVGPETYDKNAFFHPEPVNTRNGLINILYHRLMPGIQATPFRSITELQNKAFWENALKFAKQQTIITPKYSWEGISVNYPDWPGQVAGGAPPIKVKINQEITTPSGEAINKTLTAWLLLHMGAFADTKFLSGWPTDRAVGASLLTENTGKDELEPIIKVIARSPVPIMKPGFKQKRAPLTNGQTIFATGILEGLDNNTLHIFYGESEQDIRCSVFNKKDLVNYLLQFDKHGNKSKEQRTFTAG